MAKFSNHYEITYYVDGKKKKVVAKSAKERDGIVSNMKSGRWREVYTKISSKIIKRNK